MTPRPELETVYRTIRDNTEALCRPLAIEDMVVQSMPDASPAKWHLAHTTWFFETFLLLPGLPGYRPVDERYTALFNSYYNAVGEQFPRDRRGLLSRPTVAEILEYRRHVDAAMGRFLGESAPSVIEHHRLILDVGFHHEEQHQELIVTDLKHLLCNNPLHPAYRVSPASPSQERASHGTAPLEWLGYDGGPVEVGYRGVGFSWDNEQPRHTTLVEPFQLAHRLVTSGEYLAFIEDGGYRRHDLWLSDGWEARRAQSWQAPLYWEQREGRWQEMRLSGLCEMLPEAPVCHVSYYEADAYARWAGARLPLEEEWETAAAAVPVGGNLLESKELHPMPLVAGTSPAAAPAQLFGDVWEWTSSPYMPYPGYRPYSGALGEYNGKFMCNQLVLRGGSCATPTRHIRATYRNFFPPSARWQFSGIRLARRV